MKGPITDEYLALWQEQARRQQKRNSFDSVAVRLDDWIAILAELRHGRRVRTPRRIKPRRKHGGLRSA